MPAGTVTFLLTDVERSSRVWEADPEAASAALTTLEALITEATTQHGGTLPVEQGEGDSSVSVFARASDAAACAIEIQRGLQRAPGASSVVPLRVRVALHTGEAELRADNTYRGAALNRCARLRSLAHGGQVVVSQATYELLVDGLPEEVELRDLGLHRLPDLGRPEHVWQLCDPELPGTFPPLRSADADTNRLPVQLTSFVGREREISGVEGLLDEARLVTLTGAGGCGKTRLALQVAADVAKRFPDGIHWVDLAPLADDTLVPTSVAAAMGILQPPDPVIDAVARHLVKRQALLVLDNCEHLIDACAALAGRLVRDCPFVTVLATSRELLGVHGEVRWPVPPLSLKASSATGTSEAEQLFVDRARAVQPSFVLTDDNRAAVAEICMRLDGIPLAIELAAARTRVLSVPEIAVALADRFHLLTGGNRSALPRQRTLESSVDWSHELLQQAERVVFRRLAVFAGSFTLDAAEAVCSGDGVVRSEVLDRLSDLVDRSLVHVADDAGPQTRYRLLETMRDYARHKLTDAGEAEITRQRHLDYYKTFVERAAAGMGGPDLVPWLARVDIELDNLRAALDWSPRSSDPDSGVSIVGLLYPYWFARSELAIGRKRLEATVEHAGQEGLARAAALAALCMVHYRAGEMGSAARYGDEAIAIARAHGDARILGRALHSRAWVRYWGEGDGPGACADFEEAARLLDASGDHAVATVNFGLHGWSLWQAGQVDQARAVLRAGLALSETAGTPHGRSYCLVVLGVLLSTLEGLHDQADERLREALALAQEVGDPYAEICIRMFNAFVEVARGRYGIARDHCDLGLATALEHHNPNGHGFIRLARAYLAYAEGDLDSAASEIEQALELVGRVMPSLAAMCAAIRAQVELGKSRLAEARRYSEEARRLGGASSTAWAVERAFAVDVALARIEGDSRGAEDRLHELLEAIAPFGVPQLLADPLEELAGIVADQGRVEEAARLLGAGQRLRDQIGAVRFPLKQPSYDVDVTAVRGALGADAFDAAWAEGAALSADEAIAYARRGRGQRKRPAHGWASLTPTETQVVALVAEGLTNAQVGKRLFISARTVQSHLSHVFAKLEVATRAELAAEVARRVANPA